MAGTFQIAPLNPIRFINLTENSSWPEIYHSKPFDLEFFKESIFDFQTHVCYFQKYQTNDTAKIQVWSDFTIDSVTYYNYDTGGSFSVSVSDTGVTFPDFTFKVLELELLFRNYGTGRGYIELIYTDEAGPKVWQSDPICVADLWENTLLLQYKNDENAFSIIFETGIEFNLRVDGILDNFQPKSERLTYADQVKNQTLLYGVPFREFRLNIGGPAGVPDWLADKLTRIIDCNQVKIDGEYYVAAEGAEVEINRNEDYPLIGYRILLNQVTNRFTQRLKTGAGSGSEGELQMVLKAVNRTDIAADQLYSGKINKYSVLHGLAIIKLSAPAITLLVGTTLGGSEISGPDGYTVDEARTFIELNWLADAAETIYLTGLTGALTDINFYYYDPLDTSTGGGGSQTPATFVKGTVYAYFEITAGDFETHWDSVTGLGILGSAYEGCAICDGRNGTPDLQGRVIIGMGNYADPSGSYAYTMGQKVGEAKHILTIDEMPAHAHNISYAKITSEQNTASKDAVTNLEPTGLEFNKLTQATGAGAAHENRQPSLALTYFLRII